MKVSGCQKRLLWHLFCNVIFIERNVRKPVQKSQILLIRTDRREPAIRPNTPRNIRKIYVTAKSKVCSCRQKCGLYQLNFIDYYGTNTILATDKALRSKPNSTYSFSVSILERNCAISKLTIFSLNLLFVMIK